MLNDSLYNELKDFIGELHSSFDELTTEERLLVFSLFTKIKMLRQGKTFDEVDDDLQDWISLGAFLKSRTLLSKDRE